MLEFPEQDLLKLISVVQRKTQMYLNEQFASVGITGGQAPFIMIVCETQGLPQSRLGELLDMDKSTVAKMLSRLEAQGYITRRVNADDCRSFDICPTGKAYKIYPFLEQVGERWVAQMTSGLTGIEQAVFYELLKKVSGNTAAYFD